MANSVVPHQTARSLVWTTLFAIALFDLSVSILIVILVVYFSETNVQYQPICISRDVVLYYSLSEAAILCK